ncbi:MAG: hypothetical protein H6842_00795 [Rhodospirillaceae bacterium]|nr:hypothetical protein [Rhodospirillaceae bacterium]
MALTDRSERSPDGGWEIGDSGDGAGTGAAGCGVLWFHPVCRRLIVICMAATAIGGCTYEAGSGVRDVSVASRPVAMTPLDEQMAERTLQSALEVTVSEESSRWHNPSTGAAGSITPVRTYRTVSGRYCREYEETITTNGNTETYRDTACRDQQGVWHTL